MTRRRFLVLLLLVVGAVLLLCGAAGFRSLYVASRQCERTVGTVKRVQTKRVYRARKLRYDSQMLVSYPTSRYGELSVVVPSYCPFRRVGDKVVVWYHPERPRDIRRPRADCCIWGILVVSGLVCVAGGLAARGKKLT